MADTTPTPAPEPQCPPVPDALLREWQEQTPRFRDGGVARERHLIRRGAQWGFTQALAATQRLAAEERQRGADEELEACCEWLRTTFPMRVNGESFSQLLRAARRPPAPTVREMAITALQVQLDDCVPARHAKDRNAMQLALQALEEAGDE